MTVDRKPTSRQTRAMEGGYAIPGDWARRGACVGAIERMEMPRQPGRAGITHNARAIEAAKTICRTCPVLAECRDWALTTPEPCDGMVAGGMTPDERREQRGVRVRGTPRHLPIDL